MIDNFILIIGAMKCGTTSLFSYLSQHPEICPAKRKEPNFFSVDSNYKQGFEFYLQEWSEWQPAIHKLAMEATINYSKIPVFSNAAVRIARYQNRASFKFIYIVRDPIERIESHYTHAKGTNWGSNILDLSQGIDPELIVTSKYALQLDEYYSRFPPENILLLNFEDLKARPKVVLEQVCSFLNIDSKFTFSGIEKAHNTNKSRVIDDELWRKFRKIKTLRNFGRTYLSDEQKQLFHSLFGKKVEGNIKLSKSQKEYILDCIAEDLARLKSQYGVNINAWNSLPANINIS